MWFKIINQHVQLHILAKPQAKKTKLVAITDQTLHIALHAKPHEGEANRILIEYIANLFKIPKSQISLQRGEKSRHKVVLIPLNAAVQRLLIYPNELSKLI